MRVGLRLVNGVANLEQDARIANGCIVDSEDDALERSTIGFGRSRGGPLRRKSDDKDAWMSAWRKPMRVCEVHVCGKQDSSVRNGALKDNVVGRTAQARRPAGIAASAVSQDTADPNVVYLYFAAQDAAALKTWRNSKETKAAQKEAGVKGAPKTWWVQEKEFSFYQ